MVSFGTLLAFAFVALGMACSAGLNMIYLIFRSITQGRMAGVQFSMLFPMGLVTNMLNPKIAVLYVSLLPQFQDPSQ